MIKVFDFICPDGHRTEHFVEAGIEAIPCPICLQKAQRTMPAPRVFLEGITGAFPGAHAQWEKKRAEKMAVQARKERDHGDTGWT